MVFAFLVLDVFGSSVSVAVQVLTGEELFDRRPASVPAFAAWTQSR